MSWLDERKGAEGQMEKMNAEVEREMMTLIFPSQK